MSGSGRRGAPGTSIPFGVETASEGAFDAVRVIGELDQSTAPALKEALDATLASGGGVLLDLAECRFIDSTGLALLVEARRELDEQDRPFAVCSADAAVMRLLELTGIDRAIELYETRDDATAALGSA